MKYGNQRERQFIYILKKDILVKYYEDKIKEQKENHISEEEIICEQ